MEKLKNLESLLVNQISWFKDVTSDKKEFDDSYAYDMVEEQFGRAELYNILAILADKK